MTEEIWKNLITHNNSDNYLISSFGNVKNKITGKILKFKTTYGGYCCINIMGKQSYIHRLVAQTFIENPLKKQTVNHIDKNRSNNNILNLEWATYKEQSKHSPKLNYTNNRCIWKIDITTNQQIKRYNTLKEAALDTTGTIDSFKNISTCARNKSKSAYGYKWEYDDKFENYDNEIWKYIDDKELYLVSNNGRIKNKNNRKMKLVIDNNGYNSFQNKAVHIIVAKKFIKNENNYPIVNHIDGNKLNNNVSNLEWTTIKNNVTHAINNGLRKNIIKVLHIDDNGNILNTYNSCSDAARILGVNCSSINKCCKNQIKSCGKNKYKFKYIDAQLINNELLSVKKNKTIKKIMVYNKQLELLEICNSITETSKKYKVNTKTVVNQCDEKIKYSNREYIFKYSL
jgi:hypothetical protein